MDAIDPSRISFEKDASVTDAIAGFDKLEPSNHEQAT